MVVAAGEVEEAAAVVEAGTIPRNEASSAKASAKIHGRSYWTRWKRGGLKWQRSIGTVGSKVSVALCTRLGSLRSSLAVPFLPFPIQTLRRSSVVVTNVTNYHDQSIPSTMHPPVVVHGNHSRQGIIKAISRPFPHLDFQMSPPLWVLLFHLGQHCVPSGSRFGVLIRHLKLLIMSIPPKYHMRRF